jgi:HSP20 family molecular chaperone IbpA
MAMEEVKKQPMVEAEKKDQPKYQIRPKYGAWMEDDERLILEVVLPGVKKANINMKSLKDYFMLRAIRDNVEYALDLELNMDIVPEKTKATYEEGLLRVELKRYNPLETAFIVPINGTKRETACNESDDDKKKRHWVLPDVVREVDYNSNRVELEIALPGVKEDQICLKVLPDWFNLVAKRDEYEYRANSGFGAEIIPEKTTAEYANGLLKIHAVIHNRMDDATKVTIS